MRPERTVLGDQGVVSIQEFAPTTRLWVVVDLGTNRPRRIAVDVVVGFRLSPVELGAVHGVNPGPYIKDAFLRLNLVGRRKSLSLIRRKKTRGNRALVNMRMFHARTNLLPDPSSFGSFPHRDDRAHTVRGIHELVSHSRRSDTYKYLP